MELFALNEKPKASLSQRQLSIQFVHSSPVCFPVKPVERISSQNNFVNLTLFQSAARLNRPIPISIFESKPVETEVVLAGLRFKMPKSNIMNKQSNSTAITSEKGLAKNRAKRTAAVKNDGSSEGKTTVPGGRIEMKFILEAPAARLVRLAADFTQWEKSPLAMTRAENGVWHAVVPLPPGNYSYRFIVDGHWCDDPHSAHKIANPFGTTNSVVCVSPRQH